MPPSTTPDSLFTLDPARAYPVLDQSDGVYLYDNQGRAYLDAIAGIAVMSVGYGRQEIVDAMAEQAAVLPYAASNIFGNRPAMQLAQRLVDRFEPLFSSVHFTSGGSEAVETGLKIARQYYVDQGQPDKEIIISRWTSYHGATLGALSVTGHGGRRKKFMPLLKDWPHIPTAYCFRCPFDRTYPDCDVACAAALETEIQRIGAGRIMAFVAEPVVGAAGGALVPPPEYWPRIREICNRHDILLMADEVLTGFGRTGRMFALDHWQVAPDMLIMAKGISGGYAPLGAIGVCRTIRSFFEAQKTPLDHIFTFAANPVAATAASRVLDILEKESLVNNARQVGQYLLDRLMALKEFDVVGDVRGLGLMAGIELVQDAAKKTPFPAGTGAAVSVAALALERGLVTYPGTGVVDGTAGDVISLFPPLTFTRQHVDDTMAILKDALAVFSKKAGS